MQQNISRQLTKKWSQPQNTLAGLYWLPDCSSLFSIASRSCLGLMLSIRLSISSLFSDPSLSLSYWDSSDDASRVLPLSCEILSVSAVNSVCEILLLPLLSTLLNRSCFLFCCSMANRLLILLLMLLMLLLAGLLQV